MRETCSSFQQPVVYNLLNGVEHAQHKQHLPQSRGASVQVWAGIIINTAIHSEESLFLNSVLCLCYCFLAEMGRIPCCGRPESSSSNI